MSSDESGIKSRREMLQRDRGGRSADAAGLPVASSAEPPLLGRSQATPVLREAFAVPVPKQVVSLESLTTEEFLSVVGTRVRRSRMNMGISRKLLAERSGVSERYLAQLETGQGNISILLLRKVAVALDVKLDEIMADRDLTLEPVLPTLESNEDTLA